MSRLSALFWMTIVLALMLCAALALAGCGGGGGGGAVGGSGEPSINVLVAAPSPPVEPPAPSGAGDCTIAYWGDSISALTAPRIDPRITVHLHAVFGGTAAAALPQFLQDPLTEPIVVIEYGANDANGGGDLYTPLTSMLARARARGRTVVLTGIARETAGDAALQALDNTLIRQQVGAGVAYADWPSVAMSLMADGVHPDDAMQQRLADALSATVLGVCKK